MNIKILLSDGEYVEINTDTTDSKVLEELRYLIQDYLSTNSIKYESHSDFN